jgi:hypothetical protein
MVPSTQGGVIPHRRNHPNQGNMAGAPVQVEARSSECSSEREQNDSDLLIVGDLR